MKVKFNGLRVSNGRGGCPVCGRSRGNVKESFLSVKTYILPSGLSKTFRVGGIEEVNERDGRFLLQYDAFEEIK